MSESTHAAECHADEALERISEGFFSLDSNWRFRYLNLTMEKFLLRSRSELVGKVIWEQNAELRQSKFGSELFRAVSENTTVEFDIFGSICRRWLHVRIFPQPGQVMVYLQDIDSEKAAADTLNQIRSKYDMVLSRLDRLNAIAEMAASIGHEVRNPMTTVRGFLQMMRGKAELERFTPHFDLMMEELDRANAIITEFLSMAKSTPSEPKPGNLNDIVNVLMPLLDANALMTGRTILFDAGLVPDILMDEKDIRQLILNLVKNGLEASPACSGVTIRTYVEGGKVVLAVADQGNGIPPEIQAKLGTPFFTTKEKGTGLGLAVCQHIADRHHAEMNFTTGMTGTTFYIRFLPVLNPVN